MTARQFKLIKFRRAIKLFTDRAAKKKMYAIFFFFGCSYPRHRTKDRCHTPQGRRRLLVAMIGGKEELDQHKLTLAMPCT